MIHEKEKKMKRLIFITIILTVIIEAGVCWKIKNIDLRRYCESTVEGKKNCWMIKEADSKYYCEAIAYSKKTCWKIKEDDKREFCKAITGQ